jgi:late competence protein required for DNA uptake (superfamily II DNA/RNA helicase)
MSAIPFKVLSKGSQGNYSQVHLIALLTASLSHYHDDFAVAVVDEVSSFDKNNLLIFGVVSLFLL